MLRIIMPILLLLGLDFFVFQALDLVAKDWPLMMKYTIFAFYWAIPIAAIAALVTMIYGNLSTWNSTFRSFLFLAYFSKVLILFALLLGDGVRLLWSLLDSGVGEGGFENKRTLLAAQIALLFGSIPFISLAYGVLRNPYRYKIFKEKVAIKDLPDSLEGLRIVQISDVHSGSFTKKAPLIRGVKLINEQEPDLVFFTGDLVNHVSTEMTPYIEVFDKIRAKYGVFSVFGNHDYGDYVRWRSNEDKVNNLEKLKNIHHQLGWNLLLNEHRILSINNEKVAVIGIENYSASARFSKYGNLEKAHQGSDSAVLKLLLSHDPSHWRYQVTKDYKDIDITFSGHTHGMQFGVEWGKYFKWSPVQYVYKEWAGLYREGRQYLYVNRGFGFLAYPGRVGILPEITVIEVVKG